MAPEDRIGDIVVHDLANGRSGCHVVAGVEDRQAGCWTVERFAAPAGAHEWGREQLNEWIRWVMIKRLEGRAYAGA